MRRTARHRRRAAALRLRAEVTFLGLARHGDHDQSDHGAWASGGGGGSSGSSYTSTYGEVLDEANVDLGGGDYITVAVTDSGDMHLASDPAGGSLDDRDVFVELEPDTAHNLAGELRGAASYEPTGDEIADDEGIIASSQVQGLDDIEVWVHETGDVGIRNVNEEGVPGYDFSASQAVSIADALDNMADFYDAEFEG